MKEALVNAPVLALPNFSPPYAPFDVICDASGFGIGAVLMQGSRPIAFEGRKMTPPETRYTVGEQELLAVHHALVVWRCYLEVTNCPVNVITDHAPNTWLASQPTLSRRQARWSEYFQRFKLTWQYRPGRNNVADPLSRSPAFLAAMVDTGEPGNFPPPATNTFSDVGESIRQGYLIDDNFGSDAFVECHGLFKDADFWYKGEQIAVPDVPGLRLRCMDLNHSPVYCGHLGGNRTYHSVKQLFWWNGLKEAALQFVKDCNVCQANKHPNTKPVGLLKPLQVPMFRWESVSMDFIVQLPETKYGHDAIVVFVDRLSKMVHFAATTTTVAAKETARLFRHNVFRLHGIPRQIASDRDTRFTSHFWKEVCSLLGIDQGISTSFHPQTDGQTERVNRILEDMLRHYVNPMENDWDEHLDAVEFAINNAWQESIRSTPFVMNYGLTPVLPHQLNLPSKVPAALQFSKDWQVTIAQAKKLLVGAEQRMPAAELRQKQAEEATQTARQNIQNAQIKQKLQAATCKQPFQPWQQS